MSTTPPSNTFVIAQNCSKVNNIDGLSPLSACEGKEADVLFLIDASRSIWAPDFNKLLRFVRGVARQFDVSDSATRVGVLAFSDITSVEYRLEERQDRASVARAIVNVAQVGQRHFSWYGEFAKQPNYTGNKSA